MKFKQECNKPREILNKLNDCMWKASKTFKW